MNYPTVFHLISDVSKKADISCILIALKLHSLKYNPKIRENKDIPDIINLVRINKIDSKSKKFRELCLRYGTEKIYHKILERI